MYAVFIYKYIHTNMYLDLTRGVVPTCIYVLIRYSYSVYIVVEVLLYFDICMYVCVNDMAVCWRLSRLLIELRSTWSAMRWCFWSARDTWTSPWKHSWSLLSSQTLITQVGAVLHTYIHSYIHTWQSGSEIYLVFLCMYIQKQTYTYTVMRTFIHTYIHDIHTYIVIVSHLWNIYINVLHTYIIMLKCLICEKFILT